MEPVSPDLFRPGALSATAGGPFSGMTQLDHTAPLDDHQNGHGGAVALDKAGNLAAAPRLAA
jgi:isoaspartyl peptidase/L-asparaginase-like protein (Ntn-hydrolase superfamily)